MDPKGLLPPFMQTKKEGGSSLTHPLAKLSGDGQGSGESGSEAQRYGEEAGAAAGSDMQDDQYRQGIDANDQRGMGEEREMGSGRRADDIASARQDYIEDREAAQQRDMESRGGMGGVDRGMDSRQAATGLEQQDGYAAAAQAGALPDRDDIRNVDREVGGGPGRDAGMMGGTSSMMGGSGGAPQLVGDPDSGFNSSMPGSTAGMTGSTQSYDSTGLGGDDTAGSVPSEVTASGGEGLIHGHHNTRMGEVLDPHLKQ